MVKKGSTRKENTCAAVAVIGMGCIFPKSKNLKAFWHLLFNGIDAIDEIPESHWKIADYYDPDPARPDHTYCKRGGFLPPVTFDPLQYGMPPKNIEATDTSQLLSLEVARMALEDAGYPPGHAYLEQKKVNVVLGVTGTQELVIPLGARLGHPIWKKALKDSGLPAEKSEEVLDRIQADYVQWQENSFPGLLGNVISGRIANRFNLSGTNCACDAACASSLSALHTAVMELSTHKCDMSITGGADTLNDIFMHMCFSKTGVLSHTSDARPFSKDADGTVLGEGVGMLVLKRLEDAKKDKDRIYAVLKSVGTSSDGRTSAVYAPESKGQIRALEDAYAQAGIDPATVGLIEAHGTGTRVGDKVEFEALKHCFGKSETKNKTAIGSVKSMIGHTKAAAGVAGMIKSILALHHKVIPPTLKADKPDPELDINHSSFYLNSDVRPWIHASQKHPRRTGVSAFGFGGSNFHAVLEEYDREKEHVAWDGSIQIFAFSADEKSQVQRNLEQMRSDFEKLKDPDEKDGFVAERAHQSRQEFDFQQPVRLVIVHKTADDLNQDIITAVNCLETGKNNGPVYLSFNREKGKLGFLFPGQGSQYTGMGKELVSAFPEAFQALEKGTGAFSKTRPEKALDEYIFAPPSHLQAKKQSEEQLRRTNVAQPAIGAVSLGLIRILKRFGIKPDAVCGHSYGELSALYAAGWIDEPTFLALSVDRGKYMALAGEKNSDAGSMLAVQARLLQIENLIKENDLDLVLANRNSPAQGVLSGRTDEILRAKKICKKQKIRAVQLPVAAAFHTVLVKDAAKPFSKSIKSRQICPTGIGVLSNTLGGYYEADEQKAKKILANQLANPVLFVENIEKMAADGVDTFIEVGPKAVLTGLVKAILQDHKVTVAACDDSSKKHRGIEKLAHVLARIAVNGFDIDLTPWEEKIRNSTPKKMQITVTGANAKPSKKCERPVSEPMPLHPSNDPAPVEDRKQPLERPIKRESGMTTHRKTNPAKANTHSMQAMEMVRQGLEAMQQLQTQTARAHEKFLETQAQASQTLAAMMEQTRMITDDTIPYFERDASPAVQPPAETAPDRDRAQDQVRDQVRYAPRLDEPVSQVSSVDAPASVNETTRPASAASQTPAQDQSPKVDPAVIEETASQTPSGDTLNILYRIVSDLTGFPVEMLEPQMDIESDLGIDSIKKVEIISELEKAMPSCEGLGPDHIGSVRTLNEICLAISDAGNGNPADMGPDVTAGSTPETLEPASSDASAKVAGLLVETISELTGFPVEMLEPSMNLESDLGIDSIKRVEILSKLEQQLDHIDSISSDDIAALKTIGEIIDYLSQSEPSKQSECSKESVKKKLQKQASEEKTGPKPKELTRQVVRLKEYPTNQIRFYNGARTQISPGKKVYITRDTAGLSQAFAEEFSRTGVKTEQIDIMNHDAGILDHAAGIVLVPDAFNDHDHKKALAFFKKAFELVKINGPQLMENGSRKGAFLAAVSFMGGTFGFGRSIFATDPVWGGLPGFIKTAAIEFKNVLCRALDMPDDLHKCVENVEAAVALMMTHGSVEMGIDGDSCYIPQLEKKDTEKMPADISGNDVFVITGGAKGVTAACALELAQQYRPVIILIGRSELTRESEWARGLNAAADLKRAILEHAFADKRPKPADIDRIFRQIISNREVSSNIERIRRTGAKVKYYSADVTDADRIRDILKDVGNTYGHITGIVHGAGILEDKRIVDKTAAQFSKVIETKVNGLKALLGAVSVKELKYLVLFSSVAARTGNQGQCDYALANEILNKIAAKFKAQYPETNVLSINWGPWEGGMVNASLKKEFEKRGIDLIPLAAGAAKMVDELGYQDDQGPEIVIGAHLVEKDARRAIHGKVSKAFSALFGVEKMPVLSSHCIGGEPVVPFALLMEYQALAAERSNPGLVLSGMDNMRLLKGLRVATPIKADINMGKCRKGTSGFEALSTITSKREDGSQFTHTSGIMRLKEKRMKPPVLSKAAFMALEPYGKSVEQAYDQVLFHGVDLKAIQAVNGYSEKGIEVVTSLSPEPLKWIEGFPNARWTLDPLMLDAAFQTAILWTFERKNQVCLPSFMANFRLYSSFDSLKGNVRILFTVNEETKNKIKGYFTFLNEDQTVVASITGFEAIVDPQLHEKFKNRPLFSRQSILAFAEGKPSEAFGDKYKVFDEKRQIARLPRPPYFFMDRVLKADHPQWIMKPGGEIETQYDIPADAWYFNANQTRTLPFCVLLEIALQPCGWLAAYAGSALLSEDRLHFRNLGGRATLHRRVDRTDGTLTVRCNMKEVSRAGGMIIQDFNMTVLNRGEIVYNGTTNFGFFTAQALANQVGIRNSRYAGYRLPDHLPATARKFELPKTAPFDPADDTQGSKTGMPAKALLMIDSIDQLSFEGGLYEKGYIRAVKNIDPDEWFFDAHFYQDPVCPGSLGIESFLQLIRYYLLKKFDFDPADHLPDLVPGQTHEWVYRGQIIPKNKVVEVHVHIKDVISVDKSYSCAADGALIVDGICIYEMTDFSFAFSKAENKGRRQKAEGKIKAKGKNGGRR